MYMYVIHTRYNITYTNSNIHFLIMNNFKITYTNFEIKLGSGILIDFVDNSN